MGKESKVKIIKKLKENIDVAKVTVQILSMIAAGVVRTWYQFEKI